MSLLINVPPWMVSPFLKTTLVWRTDIMPQITWHTYQARPLHSTCYVYVMIVASPTSPTWSPTSPFYISVLVWPASTQSGRSLYILMSTSNKVSLILVLKLSTSLHSSVPTRFQCRSTDLPHWWKHRNQAELKNLDDFDVLSSDFTAHETQRPHWPHWP